jgi:multiple sugar transport system permease protein
VTEVATAGPAATRPGIAFASDARKPWERRFASFSDRAAPGVFLLPAVVAILALSIFPLIVSAYLSLTRFKLVKGGFTLQWIGLFNYQKLLFGSQQFHLLGTFHQPTPIGWAFVTLIAGASLWLLVRSARAGVRIPGLIFRVVVVAVVIGLALLAAGLATEGGELGTFEVTLVYVFGGVTVQFAVGLGLAFLCAQRLAGRRFFRVVFFMPMMITPVGVAYTFRMVTDTTKGPFTPLWGLFGLTDYAWSVHAWSARLAVMIGDAWQWIPFMFIVLLAAIENQPREQMEAAMVDGASRWQIFRHITVPTILPVSITLFLIRVIEAFKIVDLPNVMTNGGPGIATESMTLHAFIAWRTLDLGGSSAVAYMLLIVVAFFCTAFLSFTREVPR